MFPNTRHPRVCFCSAQGATEPSYSFYNVRRASEALGGDVSKHATPLMTQTHLTDVFDMNARRDERVEQNKSDSR